MNTLYARLSAALLLLLLLLGTVTLLVTVRTSRLHMLEVQQKLHRDLAAKVLEDQPLLYDASAREQALDLVFEKLMVINPDIEVYLLDRDGSILGFSAPPGRVRQQTVDLGPVDAFLRADVQLPILGTDPRNPGSPNIFSVARVRGDADPGYLYIVLESEQRDSVLSMVGTSYIVRTGVFMVTGSMVLALIGGLIMFRRLTERRKLEELEARDAERRELLANISHDVRTPLTHLQGYLETLLLKGGSLSDEERAEYLEIAVQRSEQLGRLIADLLDLARLDEPKRRAREEEFSVAELAQDVAQQFKLVADERGIALTVEIRAERARIRGDLGTIERALQNLVENAVRYSRPGDRVDVRVARSGDDVEVSICDTGPGIPSDELEHIFDRFYRCRKRGAGSQEGSGLGLSIARRALELHGSDLQCESRVGEGTTFRFALRCVAEPT